MSQFFNMVRNARTTPAGAPTQLTPPGDKLSPPDKLQVVTGPAILNNSSPGDTLEDCFETLDGVLVNDKCVQVQGSVQSAHTSSEHLLYTAMWKLLGSREDDSPSREGTVSVSQLAGIVSISHRNVQRILQSLQQKLAIEVTAYEDGANAIPRRYRVYSFRATMERRRQAGYTHIYRNRNLITLARLKDAENKASPHDKLSPHDNLSPPDSLSPGPHDKLSPPIRNISNIQKTTTTTDVRARLQADLPTFDDDAVEKLWTACRAEVPDVTAEEVHALFRVKLPESRSRLIESPNGFLLRAVARSCTVAAVSAMRRQGREAPADVGPRLEEAELRDLLGDPNTPLELRQQITQKLKNA